MSGDRFCRVCGGVVTDPAGWVRLDGLGRFWWCERHREGGFFYRARLGRVEAWVYANHGQPDRLVLGPYPYERSDEQEAA